MIEAGALFLTLPNLFHPNQFNKAILWIEEMIYLKRLFKSHSLILSALWSNCLKFYELKSLTILSPLIMTALIVDMRCWPAWKLDNKIIRCSLHLPLLPAPVNEWNQPQKITSEILKSEMHSAVQDNCSWPNLKLSWNRRYGERVYIAYSRTKTRNTDNQCSHYGCVNCRFCIVDLPESRITRSLEAHFTWLNNWVYIQFCHNIWKCCVCKIVISNKLKSG